MNPRRQPIGIHATRRLLPLLILPVLLLSGCGVSTTPATLTPSTGVALQGRVRGGQQPVVGAHVYLFAANTTGNGGPGIAASSSNASVSLLNSSSTGHSDSVGAYVLTDSTGAFSITGDYTCTSGQQVYLYALGGNPGSGTNSSASFLAVLGNCPVAGNFAGTVPFIWMNEISTVAAAYAFAAFASDATHVSSSGTALAKVGIANAFATAANLANIATGAALTTTPAGNGTAPAATVITLANILATCVNSADQTGQNAGPSAACNSLAANLTYNGVTGSIAGDTASDVIYIAHNPSYQVATLYGLPGSNLAFGTGLTSAPNNFFLILSYTNGLSAVQHQAIDASGNLWLTDGGTNTINEFGPTGAALAPSGGHSSGISHPGFLAMNAAGNLWVDSAPGGNDNLVFFNTSSKAVGTSTGISSYGSGIAFDASGNIWVPNSRNNQSTSLLSEYNSSGTDLANLNTGGLDAPINPVVDGSGNVWTANQQTGTLSEFTGGVAASGSPFNALGGKNPSALAIDPSGNLWTVNTDFSLSEASSAGVAASGSPFNTGSSYSGSNLAIDSFGQVWEAGGYLNFSTFTENYSLFGFSSTGASLTGSSGITLPSSPSDIAIDGSGNLWVATHTSLTEVVGAAGPVVTPIVANLINPYTHPASRP